MRRPAETLAGESEIVGGQCEKHAPSAELFETIAVKSVLNVKSADTFQQGSAVVIEKTQLTAIFTKSLAAKDGVDTLSAETAKNNRRRSP